MEKELELLKLKLEVKTLQAQSLERDILVREYTRLIGEAQEIRQQIMKIEEEEEAQTEGSGSEGIEL